MAVAQVDLSAPVHVSRAQWKSIGITVGSLMLAGLLRDFALHNIDLGTQHQIRTDLGIDLRYRNNPVHFEVSSTLDASEPAKPYADRVGEVIDAFVSRFNKE